MHPTARGAAIAERWIDADKLLAGFDWEKITGVKSGRQLGIHRILSEEYKVALEDDAVQMLKELYDDTKEYLKEKLLPIALPHHETGTQLFLPLMDLVHYRVGEKEQLLHHDATQQNKAEQRWSVLFFLHNTISTSLPQQPLAVLDRLWAKKLSAKEKKSLTNPNLWASTPVPAGTILLFKQCTAHYGVPDPVRERIVLFSILSPNPDTNQTVWQRRYTKMHKTSKDDSL